MFSNTVVLARATQLGTPPNVEFRLQDVLALQGGERFDVVWLHHVLEHIEDVSGVLSALARVSSKALIEVPDIEQNWGQRLLRELRGDYFSDATHVREYDKALMLEHLGSAQFEAIEIRQVAGVLQVAARREREREADPCNVHRS